MQILLIADKYNSKYYSFARNNIDGHSVIVPKVHYDVLSLYLNQCKRQNVDAVILSNEAILQKLLLKHKGKAEGKLTNWAGAVFYEEGVKVLISAPFKQLCTSPTAPFLFRWYINKALGKSIPATPELVWDTCNSSNIATYYEKFQTAEYIAVDIETMNIEVDDTKVDYLRAQGQPVDGLYAPIPTGSGKKTIRNCIPIIDMIGYCGLFKREDGSLESIAIVLHLNTMEDILWMRKFNALQAPKICQNGGYEGTHLIRYNAPLYNWLCDTFHFMHSWFAELPRTLDRIASMFIKDFEYWKDESSANRALYNAKDTHYTLWSWVLMVNLAPEWAKTNYLIEFRKCFPNICCGLEGLKVDMQERSRLDTDHQQRLDHAQSRLDSIVYSGFNPNSPKQVKAVMEAVSGFAYKSTDDKALTSFAEKGVLEAIIAECIREVRAARKALSTYIRATLFDGRLLYELNSGGTDTGRMSSKSSNLWVGTQIQNQDSKLRSMYVADDGWIIANCDGSQAESRTTAYNSQDLQLIDSVENAPDFHKRNASLFFGIPEDEITKPIRTLSKRVNHGANYNMGVGVLIETMGVKNIAKAKQLLGLPPIMSLARVAQYLLDSFDKTYPDIRGRYYDEIIEEVRTTRRITVANGWTRYCFDTPARNRKLALNKYVAHPNQCLSVMMVDEAYFDFWLEYQIHQNKIRLKAQIHDEVVYQVRGSMEHKGVDEMGYDVWEPVSEDFPETKKALADLMARPLEVNGRTLIIPNDGGGVGNSMADVKD